MKYIVQISRFIVGIIFIISGFVKAVDPIGFGYKLEEYFAPDVFNIGFLHDLALPQATFFSIFEIILGVFLLLGIFRKFTTWSLLILIIFFTFLTFYSAYFNKVTDCGCFGDAMKLTPWQSFWKDIFLLILIIIIFFGQKYIKPFISNMKVNYGISVVALLICVWIAFTGIKYLPIIDFRAYAIGKNLPEGMQGIPDEVEYTYILKDKKTGEEKEFKEFPENYEVDYEYLDSKTNILKKGVEAPVKDFVLDCDGEDKTEFYLNEPKVVLFIAPFAEKVSAEETIHLNKLYKELTSQNVEVAALSNADLENVEFPYCLVDQIALKTIIRNNPGIIVLEEGTVVGKFHDNPLPDANTILNSFK